MKAVFADTAYFQAFLNSKDAWHAVATDFAQTYEGAIVSTQFILIELGATMSRGYPREVYTEFVKDLRTLGGIETISASEDLFNNGFDLFAARADKEWSLTDCISFVAMKERGIRDALSTDHHFVQAGFNLLL